MNEEKKEHSVYAVKFASQQMLIDKLQKQNAELIKTKNKALSYIQNYNHMNLRYQDSETKDKLNLIKNILNGREDYQDKLQNNWNELKKWLEEVIEDINKLECPDSYDISEKVTLKNIVKKMQELEGNNEHN